MCKTMKLKFACGHTSMVRLSKCLAHRTKPSVKTPGKTKTFCKGKPTLKRKMMAYGCPTCVRENTRRQMKANLDKLLEDSRALLPFLKGKDRTQIIEVRRQAWSKFEAEMETLDAQSQAAQRRSHEPATSSEDREAQGVAAREQRQRKLDAITQYYERRVQRCLGAWNRTVAEAPTCEKTQDDSALPVIEPKMTLRLHAKKRTSDEADQTEPVCERSDLLARSDSASPRPLKRMKLLYTKQVAAT